MKKIIILTTLIFIITCGCKNNKPKLGNQISQMTFNVTDSLLGESFHDTISKFSFRVPKLYTKNILSDEESDKISKVGLKLVYSSSYKKEGCDFAVIDLNKLNDSLFALYRNALKTSFANNKTLKKVGIDSFYSNKILFTQYFAMSDSSINLKLLTSNYLKGHYEIDFHVPINIYNAQARTIESVLGSVK